MEFYDTIKQRRSIRSMRGDPISDAVLMRILEAGRLAPSWCNRQCWRFLVVKDGAKLKQLADILGENSAAEAVRQAPVSLLVLADPSDSARFEGKSYYLADAAIAMEHIILAATAEGLGTCWVGAFSEYSVRNLFALPRDISIIGITPIGYPNETPAAQVRRPLNEILYYDQWKQ